MRRRRNRRGDRGTGVKLAIIAGPASVGKTAVVRQIIREFRESSNPAYVKIDVVRAFEDEELREEFGIPTRKVCNSGDLCPDHAGIMVLQDAISWAQNLGSGLLIIESAGLCLSMHLQPPSHSVSLFFRQSREATHL